MQIEGILSCVISFPGEQLSDGVQSAICPSLKVMGEVPGKW
jgi:hypothetical protein